jgi:hypothetical protein
MANIGMHPTFLWNNTSIPTCLLTYCRMPGKYGCILNFQPVYALFIRSSIIHPFLITTWSKALDLHWKAQAKRGWNHRRCWHSIQNCIRAFSTAWYVQKWQCRGINCRIRQEKVRTSLRPVCGQICGQWLKYSHSRRSPSDHVLAQPLGRVQATRPDPTTPWRLHSGRFDRNSTVSLWILFHTKFIKTNLRPGDLVYKFIAADRSPKLLALPFLGARYGLPSSALLTSSSVPTLLLSSYYSDTCFAHPHLI